MFAAKMSSLYRAIFCSILAAILWGSGYPVMKIALMGLGPLDLALYRAVFASLFMILVFPKRRIQKFRREDIWFVLFICLTGTVLMWVMTIMAVQYSTPIKAAFLVNTNPLFILIFAFFFLREPIGTTRLAGIIIAALGAYVIISNGQLLNLFASETILGDTFALIAAVSWGTYIIIYRKKVKEGNIDSERLTTQMFILAIPILLVISVAVSHPFSIAMAPISIQLSAIYMGLIASGLAYFLFNYGLKSLGASASATNLFVIPVSATVFSYVIVNEPISFYKLVGGALILAGISLTSFKLKYLKRLKSIE